MSHILIWGLGGEEYLSPEEPDTTKHLLVLEFSECRELLYDIVKVVLVDCHGTVILVVLQVRVLW